MSASTPGTYLVTYTTNGPCPNMGSVPLTVAPLDDASFSYPAASFCANGPDPTPTVTGLPGGTFTATPAGLMISAGTVDVSASTPGTYTVTYTTNGPCPNMSSVPLTVAPLDDASFTYPAASFCATGPDPTPTVTGLAAAPLPPRQRAW
ncbi:MAG: hypothetical protein H6577_16425 [Lewinellaceae bacterium]|nr:hypothetical protein [Lewinellaceae bacterium]